MVLSVSDILILFENMLLILDFETFNQITTENWWKCVNLLRCNKVQMLGACVTTCSVLMQSHLNNKSFIV